MVPWIKIATDISADPKVDRVAKACGVNDAEALGLVVAVLTALPRLAADGNLAEVSDAKLEAAALWERKRGVFAAAFRQVWCEADVVRNWDRWNGATLRTFERDRKRAKDWRDKQKGEAAQDALVDPSSGPYGVPYGVREPFANADRTQERGKREEVTTSLIPEDGVIPSTAPDVVKAWVAPHGHAALDALFAVVSEPTVWVGSFRAWASGMGLKNNRPASPARLAAAVQEFVAMGKHRESGGPSLRYLRGFVEKAKDTPAGAPARMTDAEHKAEQLRDLRDANDRRQRMGLEPKPLPVWADQIDAMFPDGRTYPVSVAA